MVIKQSLHRTFGIEQLGHTWVRKLARHAGPDYKLLFEAAAGLSLVVSPDAPRFTVIALSDAFAQAAGWDRDDVIGRGLLELLPDAGPSDHAARRHVLASLLRVATTGAPDTVAAQQLCIGRARNQESMWSATNTPVFGPDGVLRYIVHHVEDVTSSIVRERQRDEWISLIAHDLLQPLNTISGYAQLLSRGGTPPAQNTNGNRYAERIRRASELLARMVGDLLDTSRLESQTMTLICSDVDLALIVRRTVDQLPELAARCRIQGEHNNAIAWADAARIEQVLGNLLTNAGKYSDDATPIDVILTREEHAFRITVGNQGPAIAAADRTRIFNRFVRGARARADGVSGLGLGLHICRGLVQAHGGRIWVECSPGRRTRFHFTLPLARGRRAPVDSTHPDDEQFTEVSAVIPLTP